jgi:hypothetical protein
MSSRIAFGGLCSSCTQSAQCTFPREPGYSIRFCDEYCAPGQRCSETISKAPVFTSRKIVARPSAYKGLCSICDQHDLCTFPRNREVPVMFCEEHC